MKTSELDDFATTHFLDAVAEERLQTAGRLFSDLLVGLKGLADDAPLESRLAWLRGALGRLDDLGATAGHAERAALLSALEHVAAIVGVDAGDVRVPTHNLAR